MLMFKTHIYFWMLESFKETESDPVESYSYRDLHHGWSRAWCFRKNVTSKVWYSARTVWFGSLWSLGCLWCF